jgi:hypothetical protein
MKFVVPAQAGTQAALDEPLDSRFRGNDGLASSVVPAKLVPAKAGSGDPVRR